MADKRYLNKGIGGRLRAAFLAASMVCLPGMASASPDQGRCVKDSEVTASTEGFHSIHRNLERAGSLPVSGRHVYNLLKDPANDVKSCIVPRDSMGPDVLGRYVSNNKAVLIYDDVDPRALAHENFHAAQNINGGFDSFRLDGHDFVIGNLLIEATAVGYSYVYFKEAGDSFSLSNSSYGFGRHFAFNAAYEETWKKLKDADPQVRKEKSLEAGGKAVVRSLLNNDKPTWTNAYVGNAKKNLALNFGVPRIPKDQEYALRRDDIYSRIGYVSPNINLTPDELIGARSDVSIEAYIKKSGYKPPKPPKPPKILQATLKSTP